MRFLLTVILLLPVSLAAQSFPYSSDYTEKAVQSIEDITAALISDSFSPMTHYSEGNRTYSVTPSYFTVDRVMEDPDVECKDFRGGALGAGGGYALTDDLMAYVILAGLKMNGDMEYAAYGDTFPVIKSSGDYSLVSILGGGGYDLLNNDIFSIPVYFGAQVQYYSAEIKSDPVSWTSGLTYDVDMKTSGSGILYGVSGGIAVSAKIYNKVKITPYLLYIHNFNSTELDSEASLEIGGVPVGSQKFSLDVEPLSAYMTGLNIGYIDDSGFSFSVALGSMLSSLTGYGSAASSNGVDMKSVVLIFAYNI